MEHCRQAILYIKVGFPLRAVPQHVEMVRMLEQLFVKVQDMAVRVSFAQNGNETEDISLQTKTFAISLDQALARYFRRRIQRGLDRERVVLRCWNLAGFTIHRTGGGEG